MNNESNQIVIDFLTSLLEDRFLNILNDHGDVRNCPDGTAILLIESPNISEIWDVFLECVKRDTHNRVFLENKGRLPSHLRSISVTLKSGDDSFCNFTLEVGQLDKQGELKTHDVGLDVRDTSSKVAKGQFVTGYITGERGDFELHRVNVYPSTYAEGLEWCSIIGSTVNPVLSILKMVSANPGLIHGIKRRTFLKGNGEAPCVVDGFVNFVTISVTDRLYESFISDMQPNVIKSDMLEKPSEEPSLDFRITHSPYEYFKRSDDNPNRRNPTRYRPIGRSKSEGVEYNLRYLSPEFYQISEIPNSGTEFKMGLKVVRESHLNPDSVVIGHVQSDKYGGYILSPTRPSTNQVPTGDVETQPANDQSPNNQDEVAPMKEVITDNVLSGVSVSLLAIAKMAQRSTWNPTVTLKRLILLVNGTGVEAAKFDRVLSSELGTLRWKRSHDGNNAIHLTKLPGFKSTYTVTISEIRSKHEPLPPVRLDVLVRSRHLDPNEDVSNDIVVAVVNPTETGYEVSRTYL